MQSCKAYQIHPPSLPAKRVLSGSPLSRRHKGSEFLISVSLRLRERSVAAWFGQFLRVQVATAPMALRILISFPRAPSSEHRICHSVLHIGQRVDQQ